MPTKSKQRRAEAFKTDSISKLADIRLKVLKTERGIIEIVNSADNGRVCSIKVSDFRSRRDAAIYAELFSLAPDLLHFKNTSITGLEESMRNVERRARSIEARIKKILSRMSSAQSSVLKQSKRLRNEKKRG